MPTPARDKATQQEVRRLLKRLARAKDDWPSEPALRDLSPQMVDALLNYMERQGRVNLRTRLAAEMLLFLYIGLLHSVMRIEDISAVVVGLLVGAFMWGGLEPDKKYSVYALTQTRDMRVLPTLIKATNNEWACHPQVIGAISRLLQQVTEADAGRLSQKAQNRLWAWAIVPTRLGPEYNEVLVKSILHAFAQIGSRETLKRMQNFAHDSATFPTHRHVSTFIKQLTPIMEARLQRQEVPQTLLRASDASLSTPDTLLRATHPTTTEPTAQLLRAAACDDGNTPV